MADDAAGAEAAPQRRSRGLSRSRIVVAAIELADAEGLAALSMARLAERLDCGTMSLYRHVASKDELLLLMLRQPRARLRYPLIRLTGAPRWPSGQPHCAYITSTRASWPQRRARHRIPHSWHGWKPALSALARTGLPEPDKLSAVMSVLYCVRGAAALAIAASTNSFDRTRYRDLLRQVVDADRFPAIATALSGGAFEDEADLVAGVQRVVLDGIGAHARRG